MLTEAKVKTGSADLYLKKLCRHFSHKVPASMSEGKGVIEFPFGRCLLGAEPDALNLHIELADAEQVSRAEEILASHLKRMAPRETLRVNWYRA